MRRVDCPVPPSFQARPSDLDPTPSSWRPPSSSTKVAPSPTVEKYSAPSGCPTEVESAPGHEPVPSPSLPGPQSVLRLAGVLQAGPVGDWFGTGFHGGDYQVRDPDGVVVFWPSIISHNVTGIDSTTTNNPIVLSQ